MNNEIKFLEEGYIALQGLREQKGTVRQIHKVDVSV